MTATISHFAINADDVEEAKRFYEDVFGWTFRAWGPPEFYKVEPEGSSVVIGALQRRRNLLPDAATFGFECTFAVDDVDEIAEAVLAGGGRLLMEKTTIAGVGDLIWFADPAGNAVGAMRYDDAAD